MAVDPKSLKNLTPWPKGVSGNPKGAAKGKRWKTVLSEILELAAQMPAADSEDSSAIREREMLEGLERILGRKPTYRDVVAFKQMSLAQDGDTTAFRAIAEREEGRPGSEKPDDDVPENPLDGQTLTNEQLAELVKIARGEK